jgi:SSS family solute:Na+ symporter
MAAGFSGRRLEAGEPGNYHHGTLPADPCRQPARFSPMETPDYIVLIAYFVVMAGIGLVSMLKIRKQEDFFMGGRSFGKILQTFAAFGAGTGSGDPINTARTTFTSGLSGIWSIFSWLFCTPFYWITGVWYRRMRNLTLGDWFVERYQSKHLGAAYTLFGLYFYMIYMAMLFTAVGKFSAPLIGDAVNLGGSPVPMEYVLVPVIAVIVILYGVLGGLTAAYWTDLIQGTFIILLSVLLIPFGLWALVEKFGDPAAQGYLGGMFEGFRIMHDRVPESMFTILGSTTASEFPVYRIVAVAVILLVGVVVQPHFIATGGGSAKTETNARVGLVTGNFFKRFCTIGWALTALIVLALMADSPELKGDPDKVWGVASRELLWPGLRGLMLGCLLAALMSSADCYMLVCSALVVRNVYAAYVKPDATEKQYVLLGRITGMIVIVGAVIMSWTLMDVFKQLQRTWLVPMLFAAPFWVGMYWRRATTAAAWGTVLFVALVIFIVPWAAPRAMPDLRDNENFLDTNRMIVTTITHPAAPTDVAGREAEIQLWEQRRVEAEKLADTHARQAELDALGPKPERLAPGEPITKRASIGGQGIYWSGGVKAVDQQGNVRTDVKRVPIARPRQIARNTTDQIMAYPEGTRLKGFGSFKLEALFYEFLGVDLSTKSDATLATLDLPVAIIAPFLVMIVLSLVTKPADKQALDRLYVKMKTPVDPDPESDRREIERSYADPHRFDHRKLFPGTNFEIQRPTAADAIGFGGCFVVCFLIIWLASAVVMIGD